MSEEVIEMQKRHVEALRRAARWARSTEMQRDILDAADFIERGMKPKDSAEIATK